jgi:hypothetical protein
MIHPVFAELNHWDREEYAAGYRARFSDIPKSEAAHTCWQRGWEDADTEALESARHKHVLAEGREDNFEITWGNLFDAGEEARANGIPFEQERTQPWKEGWIAVDIELGILEEAASL